MHKMLKNLDIQLFFICLFIITVMGIYVVIIAPPNIQMDLDNNLSVIVSDHSSYIYSLKARFIWIIIEIFIIAFILSGLFLWAFKALEKKNKGNMEMENNINQYVYKSERANKDLLEARTELNHQTELLRKSQEKLKYTEQRYNLVFDSALIGIFEWDISENVVTVSEWVKDAIGLKNTTVSSTEFLEIMDEEDRERHVNILYQYIERKKGHFNIKEKYKLKDGNYEWFEITAKGVLSDEGLMIRICGAIKNINEQKLDSDKIKKLAYTDYLTGLPNKPAFEKKLIKSLNNRDSDDKIFMFLVDVDDLGTVNDEVGNEMGDEILKVIADRIKGAIYETSFVSRIGGDEFIILSFNIDNIDVAHKKALKIIKEFEKPFIINDEKYYITASIGIVVAPDDGTDSNFLIKNANEAMYKAKEIGKNTYKFYTESINQEIIKKLDMNNDIKTAIEKNEFFLNYQPQYNINTGKILGFETLLRWKHPDKGIIYPIDFMSIAEESGMIVSIGESALIKTFTQVQDWFDNGFNDIVISINISARQFYDKNLYNILKNLKFTKISNPEQINFEISEQVIFQDIKCAINIINKIKELGFTFTIHNVGTNLLSIINIENLPVRFIKFGRNFIATQLQTELGCDIIRIFIELTHMKNYEVIAEGVENQNQMEFLKQNGCNFAQGYYFSKPITDNQVDELLEQQLLKNITEERG